MNTVLMTDVVVRQSVQGALNRGEAYHQLRREACVRETDTVARMGGDEFTIILTNVYDADKTKIVTNEILTELAKPFQIQN